MNDSEFPWDSLRETFDMPRFDALLDPALKEATELSEILAMQLTDRAREVAISGGDEGETGRATKELDKKVSHIMGNKAVVTGLIQEYDPEVGDEADFVQVEGKELKFNGFVCSVRGNRIEFDYQFKAFLDKDGSLLDATYYDSQYGYVLFQARPNEVLLDMDIKHPLQAYAWLEMTAPEVMSELDALLLEDDNNTFGANKLESLSDFSLIPSRHVTTPRAEEQFLSAVTVYVESFLKVDDLLPYRVDICGKLLVAGSIGREYVYEPKTIEATNRLLTIEQPYLVDDTQQGEEEMRYVFAARGVLHATKQDDPGQVVTVKLKRLSNIRSIR